MYIYIYIYITVYMYIYIRRDANSFITSVVLSAIVHIRTHTQT